MKDNDNFLKQLVCVVVVVYILVMIVSIFSFDTYGNEFSKFNTPTIDMDEPCNNVIPVDENMDANVTNMWCMSAMNSTAPLYADMDTARCSRVPDFGSCRKFITPETDEDAVDEQLLRLESGGIMNNNDKVEYVYPPKTSYSKKKKYN